MRQTPSKRILARHPTSIALRGSKPGELPIQVPAKLELVVNLKTGKTIGLTIPESLLLRADEVIE